MYARTFAAALLTVGLLSAEVRGQSRPYGSGVNPADSLVVLDGTAAVGGQLVLGVQNTAKGDARHAQAYLVLSSAPDPAYPSGAIVPGWGMAGPDAAGELLIELAPSASLGALGPVPWLGSGSAPAVFALEIPYWPALTGLRLYAQGALVLLDPHPSVGLTNALAIRLEPAQVHGMVWIDPGRFAMGSNAPAGSPYHGSSEEQPVHQVTLTRGYWIGQREVTQAEYESLMGANPSLWLGPERPVQGVNWLQAMAFADTWNQKEQALGRVPTGYEYRLATEAEWEYAARAGTTTEYSTGVELTCSQARIWFNDFSGRFCGVSSDPEDPGGGPRPVGSFPPNPWGLYDVQGNVWEWVLDGFAPYTAGDKVDPFVPLGEHPFRQIVRGGGWFYPAASARSAKRAAVPALGASAHIGLRLVLGPTVGFR